MYVCVFVLQWYSPKNFQVSYTHPLQAWQKTFKQALFVTEHLADYTKPMYFKYQNIYNDIKEIWTSVTVKQSTDFKHFSGLCSFFNTSDKKVHIFIYFWLIWSTVYSRCLKSGFAAVTELKRSGVQTCYYLLKLHLNDKGFI